MEIITRTEAKALGLKRFFTGNTCAKGHVEERLTSNGACVACHRQKIHIREKVNVGTGICTICELPLAECQNNIEGEHLRKETERRL